MSCSVTYFDQLANCTDSIRVNALLQPATPYTWLIRDKFEKEYTGQSITDAQGFFDIAVSELPEGLLSPYGGMFQLSILDGTCNKIDFQMSRFYDKIEFKVFAGTRVKTNLGCPFECESDGTPQTNTGIFAFTNVATLSIPWTSLLKSIYGNTPTFTVYQETTPDNYQDVTSGIVISVVGGPYDPTKFDLDFGGPMTGYVLVKL